MSDDRNPEVRPSAPGRAPAEDLARPLDAELARIAPVAIWLSAPDGGFIHGNPECAKFHRRMHGREPRPGEPLSRWVPEFSLAAWRGLFAQAAAGDPVESDLEVPAGGGGVRIFRIHLRPVPGRDGGAARIICCAEDLTGRGEFAGLRYFLAPGFDLNERRAIEAAKRREARAEIIGNMASALAHRFNNLFTLMAGAAELLSRSPGLSPHDRGQLLALTTALDEAADTTHSLLWLGQAPVSVSKPTRLATLLTEFSRRWGASPRNRQRLNLEMESRLPAVNINPAEVIQVLEIIGAYFSGRAGRGASLTVTAGQADGMAAIQLSDDGRSISAHEQRHLFEPFTGRPEDGLLELQLAASREAARNSGGELELQDGAGAPRIILRLPLAHPSAAASADDAPDRAPGAPEGTPVILIVDDEERIRTLLTAVLDGRFRVIAAPDGPAALRLIETGPPAPAVLLTDVVMPGLTGRELADRLTAKFPDLRVIFMSGYSGDALVQRRVNEEGMAFLAKPFTPKQLLAKLEEVLALPPRRATG